MNIGRQSRLAPCDQVVYYGMMIQIDSISKRTEPKCLTAEVVVSPNRNQKFSCCLILPYNLFQTLLQAREARLHGKSAHRIRALASSHALQSSR
jgi:hypothetical protein